MRAQAVSCPKCGASPGNRCKPSKVRTTHWARLRWAVDLTMMLYRNKRRDDEDYD